MGKRGKRYFPPELKLEVIRRYAAGESLKALGEEYSIRPTLVHQWATLYRQYGKVSLRGPGRPSREVVARELLPAGAEAGASESLTAAQRRIVLLEQKLAQQALEIDFFKHALRHFETPLPPAGRPGATAPIPSSGNKRNRKAD
jgi:transposase